MREERAVLLEGRKGGRMHFGTLFFLLVLCGVPCVVLPKRRNQLFGYPVLPSSAECSKENDGLMLDADAETVEAYRLSHVGPMVLCCQWRVASS